MNRSMVCPECGKTIPVPVFREVENGNGYKGLTRSERAIVWIVMALGTTFLAGVAMGTGLVSLLHR